MSDRIEYMFKDVDLSPLIDLLQNHDISGWFKNNEGGFYLKEFQRLFAEYCGTKKALATSSGSAAIYVALRACGVERGDSVIVPAYTHIGTVAPIALAGARPVFVDVDKFGNVDPFDLNKLDKAKALIIVHQLGVPCDIDGIKDSLPCEMSIIEDVSHALGAEYRGKRAGNLGDIGCFSIGGGRTKTIGCGEGGMITVNDEDLAEKCKNIRNHGDRVTDVDYFCFNFRLSELNALVGLLQMKRIDYLNDWQLDNAKYLMDRLPEYLGVPPPPTFEKSSGYIIGCLYSGKRMTRNQFLTEIKERGFEGGVPRMNVGAGYSKLICDITYYKRFKSRQLPKSEWLRDNALWIDWHRYPRTKEEIDALLQCIHQI